LPTNKTKKTQKKRFKTTTKHDAKKNVFFYNPILNGAPRAWPFLYLGACVPVPYGVGATDRDRLVLY